MIGRVSALDLREKQNSTSQGSGYQRMEVKPSPNSQSDGRHGPDAGCGGQSYHNPLPTSDDGPSPQKADSSHYSSRHPCRVSAGESLKRGHGEQGAAEGDQKMGAQASRLAGQLPLQADQPSQYPGHQQTNC